MMFDSVFKTLYFTEFVLITLVRAAQTRPYRRLEMAVDRTTTPDKILLALSGIGMLLPLVYVFSSWLNFADYDLPDWTGWLGAVLFAVAIWLLWRSHVDLGRNWTPTLGFREDHELVTDGVFEHVRHPMYAAHILWGIAAALMLHNWIAGLTLPGVMVAVYLSRVNGEEKMMLEKFGQQYEVYKQRTRRLIPRLREPGAIVIVSCLALVAGCAQDGDMAQNADQVVGDNPELLVLYEQDQADRSADSIDWAAVGPRDKVRREKVLELLDSDELRTSEDYRHAAMVFQHGSDTTAARLAHDLARQAVALDSTNADARWLVAAAWDRYQMRLGEPQWYGTQYVMDDEDDWRLYAIDTTAVSEQEREWLGAPTMEELRARLEEPNRSGAAPGTSGEEDLMSQEEHDLRVDYVEFPTTDMGETKKFYAAVFGWKITDYGPDYASFEDGRLAGGFRAEPAVATGGPLVVIYAVNLEEVASAIRENGGRIVRETFEFPGGRRFHFTDPSGNELAVWSDR